MNTDHRDRSQGFWVSAAAVFVVALAGCAHAKAPNGAPDYTLKNHVKVVSIDAGGNADPDPVKVKKNVDIVIWVTAPGSQLTITFLENPFAPETIRCAGSFCGVLVPPSGVAKVYDYTASVTLEGGMSKKMDPRLEVVP